MSIENPAYQVGPDNSTENEAEGKHEIPEYNFESGVKEVSGRIFDLLAKQQNVVVCFSGSSAHVGKTTLSLKLIDALAEEGVRANVYHGVEEVESRIISDARVFIFEQMGWGSVGEERYDRLKSVYENQAVTALNQNSIINNGVDFGVGIYRPDFPFSRKSAAGNSMRPIADILIRNDAAKDK